MSVIVRPAPVARRLSNAARRAIIVRSRANWPTVAQVWRDTVGFSAQGASITLLSIVGFAGTTLAAVAVALASGHEAFIEAYLHASGSFATWTGVNKIVPVMENKLFVLLLAQGVSGAVLAAFARGAITWLALRGDGAASLTAVCRAAIARMPALLIGTLLYGAVIGFGAVGVNARLWNTDFDLSNAGQRAITIEGAAHVVMVRTLNALIPDPGSPAAEFVPHARHGYMMHAPHSAEFLDPIGLGYDAYVAQLPPTQRAHLVLAEARNRSASARAMAAAGLFALLIGDVVLRFRAATALSTPNPAKAIHVCARLGLRHAVPVVIHTWTMRLVGLGVAVVFVIVPIVIAQCFVTDALVKIGLPRFGAGLPLTIASIALVNGLVAAFSAVYDARLYRALAPAAD